MPRFNLPDDLKYNRGRIDDPVTYLRDSGCSSWLYLVGEEFAAMPGGMSYEQVRTATPASINVVSDPPRVLDLHLARRHVAALDELPRPTMITCRAGPRASAVAYMYSGLRLGVEAADVLDAARKDGAPFYEVEEYRAWVRSSIEALREELTGPGENPGPA